MAMYAYQIGDLIWQQITEYRSQKDYYMDQYRCAKSDSDAKLLYTAAKCAEKLEDQYCELYRDYIRIFQLEVKSND